MSAHPYIDIHGHRHSEAVLHHWSPAALKALGIRRVEPDKPSYHNQSAEIPHHAEAGPHHRKKVG